MIRQGAAHFPRQIQVALAQSEWQPGRTPGSAAIAVEKRNALLAGDAMCTWNPYTGRVGPQITGSGHESGPVLTSLRAVASSVGPAPNDGHHRATPQAPHAGLRA